MMYVAIIILWIIIGIQTNDITKADIINFYYFFKQILFHFIG